jgi:hypothetical protein
MPRSLATSERRRGRLAGVALALSAAASLFVATSGAQAVVVDMTPSVIGQSSVAYNSSDQSGYYGVALVPGTRAHLLTAGIPTVTSGGTCTDPALTSDLGGPTVPAIGLCFRGGPVMHSNETFDLAWDPLRRDWASTRYYVEQFLQDVANGSGTLTSPYADTSQYTDSSGRAAYASLYGGGCIDYGSRGGATCQLGNAGGTGAGNDYPANGCPVTGTNQFFEDLSGAFGPAPNDICLTDAQLSGELATMIAQEGLVGRTQPGYSPMLVLMTPPGIVVCLDAAGRLCSANGTSTAQFCSYHSHVNVGGTEFAYVVQPWTASWSQPTGCVEPDAPTIPANVSAPALATGVGAQLVGSLSQGQIASIVNPSLSGWSALDGSEINDNGCKPLSNSLDSVTVGTSAQNPYFLQREFNNAGVIESDPNALACTPIVDLVPTFIAPSAVNMGDVVEFDGSKTNSSLMVPNAGYVWNFGDGTPTSIGPSVVHTYSAGGSYSVKLTVTDRGANVASLSQTVKVLGPPAPVPPPPPPTPKSAGWQAHLQLMPEGLRSVLRAGLALRVDSNQAANGFVTISITRGAARRAHIAARGGATVVVGRGTVSGVVNGTVTLHLRLSRGMATKIQRLRHVTLTVRLTLAAAGGAHMAIDAAGRY